MQSESTPSTQIQAISTIPVNPKDLPWRVSGIYAIQNRQTLHVYIGKSVCLKSRLYYHKDMLKKNKHPNYNLQDAYNGLGEDGFVFVILEECPIRNLDSSERNWISFYKRHIYNIDPRHRR